ncbi:Regulator of RpoS [uncultured archaeon]|nr:Regulator of RpoS [uncultured archaeon]
MAKILIIEDEPDVAESERMLLERDDFTVEIALGGAEGIRKIKSAKPNLIVLDLLMPMVSGTDVLDFLKKNGIGIPVVVATALSSVKGTRTELEKSYRIDGFVSKTYLAEDLVREVRSVLQMRKSIKGKD